MFGMMDLEEQAANKWWDEHPCSKKYAGAIGGALTYIITPTSLGCVYKLKCGLCNEQIDVTDYDSW